MPKYQGESEDSTASKKERMKIKKKRDQREIFERREKKLQQPMRGLNKLGWQRLLMRAAEEGAQAGQFAFGWPEKPKKKKKQLDELSK